MVLCDAIGADICDLGDHRLTGNFNALALRIEFNAMIQAADRITFPAAEGERREPMPAAIFDRNQRAVRFAEEKDWFA